MIPTLEQVEPEHGSNDLDLDGSDYIEPTVSDQVKQDVEDTFGPLEEAPRKTYKKLFHLNFYRVHMLYFVIVIAVSSVILYGEGRANDPGEIGGQPFRYIDALFMCASAMTTTGLTLLSLKIPNLLVQGSILSIWDL